MSTRCHVIVIDSNDESHYVYHHCDGYPEGVGKDLKKILSKCSESGEYDWECILEEMMKYDDSYEEDSGIHGDEEYLYYIRTNDKDCITLDCYSYSFEGIGSLVFVDLYSKYMRPDLKYKYESLPYDTVKEKQAFMDGVVWSESYPSESVIKMILTEALSMSQDFSSNIDSWAKEIKNRLNKDE